MSITTVLSTRALSTGRRAPTGRWPGILEIEDMTDYNLGVTTNVGMIQGGTAVNVVPRECTVEVDLRVVTEADGTYTNAILDRKAHDPDVEIVITGGMNRPPFERNAGINALFEHARQCAAEIGLDLESTIVTGGGSDGNVTAAMGVPTLDGLGADGAGAHTLDEHILASSLAPRAKMWVRMLETLS